MDDTQDMCGCGSPDITTLETCRSCGCPVNFEDLRHRAVDIYDRDGRPIEDPDLPRRHLLIGDPSNSLRVLHLDYGTSPVLSGTFERVPITHLPPYEAISYCWGGEDGDYTKPEFIIIGGRLFPITKNCAAVLRKIRKPSKKRVIWIDSLCINQNDVNERSVQVSQMGKIFSGARKVHIYLGNNIDGRTAAKAFYVLISMKDLAEFDKRLRDKDRAEAIKTLFARTYFSRMWIIQEVLLAKCAVLHWGTARIQWQTLSEGHLDVLKRHGIHSHVPEWMRIRATANNFRKSEALGELLFSAMGSTASNDRDKVYGIYGLLFDAEEEGLTVDYRLSAKQVFTNMAAHLITKHSAFRAVLRHVNHNAPLIDGEQLPSWVPDFRSRFVSKEISISRYTLVELQISSDITPKESISMGGADELRLRGHILTIPHLGSNWPMEYSKTVGNGFQDWELRAQLQVAFDPQDHIVFWMPNGMILQLRRHPIKEDAYEFLGECALAHSVISLPHLVQFRSGPFVDTVFGLERQDLKSLWNLCMNLDRVSHQYQIEFGLQDLNLPDTSMGWEMAERLFEVHGHVGIQDGGRNPPGAQQILRFLRFCQSAHTWEVLEESNIALNCHDQYSIQDISDLCLSWLQYRETAEHIIRKFSIINQGDAVLRRIVKSKFLEHLEAWEKNSKRLLNALKWADPSGNTSRLFISGHGQVRTYRKSTQGIEKIPWPLRKHRGFDTQDRDKHKKREGNSYREEAWLSSEIRYNFTAVRLRFDLPVAAPGPRYDRVDHVLEPWGGDWTGLIQAIPCLLAISEQLQSIRSSWSRKKYFGHHRFKGIDLKIWPAETITVL